MVALAFALTVLNAPMRAQAGQYTITETSGSQPGDALGTVGLSDTGFLCASMNDPALEAFRWSPRGGVVMRPPAPTGLTWGDTTAVNVNDVGTVVGFFGTDIGGFSLTRGYRWQAGVSAELLDPTGNRAFPQAINAEGWIVGYAGGHAAGTPGAVIWAPDLRPSFVDGLDRATDINDAGLLVGYRRDLTPPYTTHGYLRDSRRRGGLVSLGTLDPRGVGDVVPLAIDSLGRVVGWSKINGRQHAFLWTSSTGMRELPGPAAPQPSDVSAVDINDAGWILGYAPTAQDGRAVVLWSPDGAVHEVEPLISDLGPGHSWERLWDIQRINSSGQLAGSALRAGAIRHVLLTPAALTASALVPARAGVVNSLVVSGAVPGRRVFLVGDREDPLDRGTTVIPGCRSMGLAMQHPHVAAQGVADAGGQALLEWSVPPSLAGVAIRLQAFQFGGCAVSQVVHVTL
ncbi:MAG: hypothetical protein ABL998_20485 [Planctomycetota bacterium]